MFQSARCEGVPIGMLWNVVKVCAIQHAVYVLYIYIYLYKKVCESAHTEYVRVPIGMLWSVVNVCANRHAVECSEYMCTSRFKTQGFVLRLPPQHKPHATFMQPFQCDLQPQLQETQRTTHTGTTWNTHSLQNTEEEPIASGTTAAATAAHTRYLSSPAAATLHEKYKVSCCGFLPKTKPMQHSCSHSNAICNHSFKKRKELRTQEQHGTTTLCRTQRRNQSRPERPQPQPPHTRGTFHRRLQPLYTEK